jgi:mono/diheme cytochrome c family protein
MKRLFNVVPIFMLGCILWFFSSSKVHSSVRYDLQYTVKSIPTPDTANLKAGQEIYTQNCGRCHRLHKPNEFTADKWTNSILPKMSKKAKLTEDQNKLVEAYLSANSKDKANQ